MARKKLLIGASIASVVFILLGEIIARFYFGLGTPPLSIVDPAIEYMYKPNQDVYRFGNHILINQYGMRSNQFSKVKQPNETRIMVFGDSVINGGNLTDQKQLATSLLEDKLKEQYLQKVTIGNISAGSWGPGNWLAYVKKYGFFQADKVVLVVGSGDIGDNPTFKPLNPNTHPTNPPVSALVEGVSRYLPRYVPLFAQKSNFSEKDSFPAVVDRSQITKGTKDLAEFLKLAKQATDQVYVFQHWEKSELVDGPKLGFNQIREICTQLGITSISLKPYFQKSLQNGDDPYRDNIHPNQVGQAIIADAIDAYLAKSKN